jgi:hypothetical protein
MEIRDYGNDLIAQDIKKLKKYKSLKKDLEVYKEYHINQILEENNLSCKKYSGKTTRGDVFWVGKQRIKITNPKTTESNGCRLWFMILFLPKETLYLRMLLYEVKDEKNYPKSICLKTIEERLRLLGISSQ